MTFKRDLIEHIERHGSITVADYMERCNAHYYATRDPLGQSGDFTTAPEISQIFGELIGAWAADFWQKSGGPEATLCEAGPGRGTLMKDALRATRNILGFHEVISVRLIETSPALSAIQAKTLQESHPRIIWQESLGPLPPLPLLLIANEFFDALPIRQFTGSVKEAERKIVYEEDRLKFSPQGDVTREASPASLAAMAQIAAHIRKHGGAALIIDYGYGKVSDGDTLQAVQQHAYADPLENPGEADLTAHVDFASLAACAARNGTYAHGPVAQGTFLKRLGAELRATQLCKAASPEQQENILSGLERIVAPHAMGELFKVMAITSFEDKPAGF